MSNLADNMQRVRTMSIGESFQVTGAAGFSFKELDSAARGATRVRKMCGKPGRVKITRSGNVATVTITR